MCMCGYSDELVGYCQNGQYICDEIGNGAKSIKIIRIFTIDFNKMDIRLEKLESMKILWKQKILRKY